MATHSHGRRDEKSEVHGGDAGTAKASHADAVEKNKAMLVGSAKTSSTAAKAHPSASTHGAAATANQRAADYLKASGDEAGAKAHSDKASEHKMKAWASARRKS